MIKRTLYFGNPTYLSLNNSQLVIKLPEIEKNKTIPEHLQQQWKKTIPIEDIGIVILDHQQITITFGVMQTLLKNNCAVITCNSSHMPIGTLLPFAANTTQTERYRFQIEASQPLKKQLWQQTIQAKIRNQAYVLYLNTRVKVNNMMVWANNVKSGDCENMEARAAVYYWSNLFPESQNFKRHSEGEDPNHLLDYGYAILRAVVARSLVSSGLLPALGIFHRNKYNAYCLADDIMEPYRPYVDQLVINIIEEFPDVTELTKEIKARLLSIPILDVEINGKKSPLMIAVKTTTASLAQCYAGELRRIKYPSLHDPQ